MRPTSEPSLYTYDHTVSQDECVSGPSHVPAGENGSAVKVLDAWPED